jgi:RND superfamily putative drug exporter
VDKLPVRLWKRRPDRPAGAGWARLSHVVLRFPVLFALPIVAGLIVLALPISHVHFGENDERQLPAGQPARVAIETVKADFPALSSVGVQVVLQGADGRAPDGKAMTTAIGKVPGIAGMAPAGSGRDLLVLTATLADPDPFGAAARGAVRDIRSLTPPAGVRMLVGGVTARNVDSLDATADRLPLMVAMLVGATLVLMFLAFGSVVLATTRCSCSRAWSRPVRAAPPRTRP